METVDIVILCVLLLLIGVVLGTNVVMAAVFLSFRKKDQTMPVQKQEEDPCLECLRWGECNGVDDGCPMR